MASTGSRTTPRGREMRELLRRWKRSGLSLQEFARKHRLSARTLAWWRWKLGRYERGGQRVELVELRREAVAAMKTTAPPVPFEVVLGNGIVVRVAAAFEDALLERVVRTLGRC